MTRNKNVETTLTKDTVNNTTQKKNTNSKGKGKKAAKEVKAQEVAASNEDVTKEIVAETDKKEIAKLTDETTKEVTEAVVKEPESSLEESIKKVAKTQKVQEVYLQFGEKEILTQDVVDQVKERCTKELGLKAKDCTDIKIYIKPADCMAYYVVNGTETGSIEL